MRGGASRKPSIMNSVLDVHPFSHLVPQWPHRLKTLSSHAFAPMTRRRDSNLRWQKSIEGTRWTCYTIVPQICKRWQHVSARAPERRDLHQTDPWPVSYLLALAPMVRDIFRDESPSSVRTGVVSISVWNPRSRATGSLFLHHSAVGMRAL
jgi:hypothetical protein